MPREEGWYFLQSGKFLERAEWTARTLDVNYRLLVGDDAERGDRFALAAADHDLEPWVTLLRSLSAYRSYHRIESRGIQPSAVIELLILSAVLPRSIRFSIGQVDAALAHIVEQAPAYNGSEPMPGSATESEARREWAGCTRSSPISGSTTCSITACTHPCSTSNAAVIASATVSRTSSSPTGL